MNIMKFVTICMVAVILSGCMSSESTNTTTYNRTTTIGQELIDLQKAKDEQVITDQEYEKGKAKLLKDFNATGQCK